MRLTGAHHHNLQTGRNDLTRFRYQEKKYNDKTFAHCGYAPIVKCHHNLPQFYLRWSDISSIDTKPQGLSFPPAPDNAKKREMLGDRIFRIELFY